MHHKRSFRRKLQTFFLSLLLVLLTVAGVPSAAYTAEAASADTTMGTLSGCRAGAFDPGPVTGAESPV